MDKTNKGREVGVSVLFVIAVSAVGQIFTSQGLAGWYKTLVLPGYAPSGTIVSIAWTVIFCLLAAAIVLSWRKQGMDFFTHLAGLYAVNGFLNVLWSYAFFSRHDLPAAAIDAGLLFFSVVVLMLANVKTSKLAAILLMPYALWVGFATVLSTHIAVLNHDIHPPAVSQHEQTPEVIPSDEPSVPDAQTSNTFTLTVGKRKVIHDDLAVTLARVDDSRCPTDDNVQCIWAGELSPVLLGEVENEKIELRLGTMTKKEGELGSYHVKLLDAGLQTAKIEITK